MLQRIEGFNFGMGVIVKWFEWWSAIITGAEMGEAWRPIPYIDVVRKRYRKL